MGEAITFRPETDEDVEFLYRLYASTREEELSVVAWTPDQKEVFLRQQFNAQRSHYLEHYSSAQYSIVLEDGDAVGRLYLNRLPGDIRIMDIALIPEARGRGIGERLLRDILEEGGSAGKSVSIHVEAFNPALRLYERMGFRQIDTYGPYLLLEWKPA